MPTLTKIGSLLNDRPVLDEMRSIISGTDEFGVPFPNELGQRVRAIIERPPTEIRTELCTWPVSESVVALTGRPVLLVRGDTFETPVLRTWASRSSAARSKLEAALPSVGCVELANSEGDFVGTGWVVADDVVITNRHVAETFARKTSRGFAIATTLSGQPLDVRVDFREEFQGVREPYEVTVKKVLFVETNPRNPDVALLKLAPGAPLPDPIAFGEDPKVKQYVAVVGYPARDPDIPIDVANRYFGNVYDVKRLSPGQVMKTTNDEPAFVFSHDCTTLGGSSGSVVVDLESGKAVGLHFAGAYRTANYAIKASAAEECAQDRSGRDPARAGDPEEAQGGRPETDAFRERVRRSRRIRQDLPRRREEVSRSHAGLGEAPVGRRQDHREAAPLGAALRALFDRAARHAAPPAFHCGQCRRPRTEAPPARRRQLELRPAHRTWRTGRRRPIRRRRLRPGTHGSTARPGVGIDRDPGQ